MDLATGADFSFTLPEQVDVHFTIKPLAEKGWFTRQIVMNNSGKHFRNSFWWSLGEFVEVTDARPRFLSGLHLTGALRRNLEPREKKKQPTWSHISRASPKPERVTLWYQEASFGLLVFLFPLQRDRLISPRLAHQQFASPDGIQTRRLRVHSRDCLPPSGGTFLLRQKKKVNLQILLVRSEPVDGGRERRRGGWGAVVRCSSWELIKDLLLITLKPACDEHQRTKRTQEKEYAIIGVYFCSEWIWMARTNVCPHLLFSVFHFLPPLLRF